MRVAISLAAVSLLVAAQAADAQNVHTVAVHARQPLNVSTLKIAAKTGRVPIVLPDGSLLRFVPLSERTRHGVTTLRGREGSARLLLTSDGSNAYGFVETETAGYRIATANDEVFIVEAAALDAPLDLLGVAPGNDTVIDEALIDAIRDRMQASRADAPADAVYSVVDMAVFIDPALLDIETPQALRTAAQAYVDYTNEAFIANGVQAELNLVLVEMFPAPFDAMNPFSGFAGNAAMHARADLFGADLRHFLYFQRAGIGYCGQAYLVGVSGVSGLQCGAGTFAHEAGHNFGAHHDRANANGNVNLPISAYNYGFVCGGAGTLMSYVGTPRLSHYSDPALSSGGASCGIAEGPADAAHNGRAIEVMRPQIEAFRTPAATYGSVRFVQTAIALQEDGTGVDIEITRDGDLTRAVSVEVATLDDSAQEQSDYEPVLARLEFAANETSKSVRIEPIDDEDFESEEAFRLVLRYPLGLTLTGSPVMATLGSDDLDRGKAGLEVESASVWENGGPVTILINRTGTTDHPLTISYATVDGTAVAGSQYETTSGQVVFAPGETRKTVTVPILDNDRYEQPANRSFAFALSGANLDQRRTQWIHVFNDDPNRGRSQFAAATLEVPENAGQASVTIQRIEGSESTLFVEYATANGTAVAGRDYVAAGGSFTFQPGEVQRVIPVQIVDNGRFDGRRTFTMTLGGQAPGSATMTTIAIVNEDPDRGLAELPQSTLEVDETTGTLLIPVTRIGGTDGTLTVSYATENGSAQSPRDFQHVAGQVSFAPGVTAATIPVTIIDNIQFAANVAFTVRLSGELVGNQVASAVTILNDDPNRGRAQFDSGSTSVAEAIGNAAFTVSRIEGSESSLTVNYATTDGSGRAGVDYQASSGTLTFAPGETARSITVPITNNTVVDAARTFSIALTGDFLGANTALTVTITNDDSAPPPSSGGSGGGGSFNAGVLLGLAMLLSRRRLRRSSQNLSLDPDSTCR